MGALGNRFTRINTPVTVPIALSGGATAPAGLILSASSSNSALVPGAHLVFSGFGANRTLTIIPQPNLIGVTTITVSASGGFPPVVERSFTLLVGTGVYGDMDGDFKTDVTIYRPSSGAWYLLKSSTGSGCSLNGSVHGRRARTRAVGQATTEACYGGLVQLPRRIVPSHRNCRRIRDKRWQDGWQAFNQLGALYCANISSQERHDIALSLGIVRV